MRLRAQVVTDFFDELKSRSRGYASMEYHITGYRLNDLVRLDIKINNEARTRAFGSVPSPLRRMLLPPCSCQGRTCMPSCRRTLLPVHTTPCLQQAWTGLHGFMTMHPDLWCIELFLQPGLRGCCLVHGAQTADPLASIVHRDNAYRVGRGLVKKLKELIPRQQFKIPIQAAIGARVIASESISALRKDVSGHVTRTL